MSDIQTFTGWASFEIGHLTPQYDQNFVVYTNLNEIAAGFNCKIRAIDLVQSNVYKYLSEGGLCRVIVRGVMHVAPTTEQGWIPTSTRYLQVTYITEEQSGFFDEEINKQQSDMTTLLSQQELEQQSQTTMASSSQQQRSTSVLSTTNIEKDDDDEDNDLDYDTLDAEEEKAHINDTGFDDSDDSIEDVSSEEIDQLNAEANMPLDMDYYVKKRDAEDFLENENSKKRKHTSSSSSCCPVVIDSE